MELRCPLSCCLNETVLHVNEDANQLDCVSAVKGKMNRVCPCLVHTCQKNNSTKKKIMTPHVLDDSNFLE